MTDWEARYQTGDTPWERGRAAPPLAEFLRRRQVAGRVLVPGCGAGHDVRALAAQGANVVGLDLAPSALRLARSYPVAGGETYVQEDLFNLPESFRNSFDWVFEHTCFCAISPERRPEYVEAVAGALKPSGLLLAIFYLDPGNTDPGPPYGVSQKELDTLFGLQFQLLEEWLPTQSYEGRQGRELMRILKTLS